MHVAARQLGKGLNSLDTSVADVILARAANNHLRCVLHTPFGSLTGSELAGTAYELAGWLQTRDPDTCAPLIIVMAGDPWTVAALLAADLVRRPAVLMHPSSSVRAIDAAVANSGADLVLRHAGARDRASPDGGEADLDHALTRTDVPLSVTRMSPNLEGGELTNGFVCHETSGTAGSPKLALRTRGAVMAEMNTLQQVMDMAERDVVLCASSVSHSYGCVGGLLTPLLVGASVTIVRNAQEAEAAICRAEPSIVFGLGPMYARLAEGTADLIPGLKKVRYAFSAGAPLSVHVYQRFVERFGVPIRQDYGTTETGTITLDLEETPHPESIGRPLPQVEVQLRPPDTIPLHLDEVGEVLVRSPFVADGYLIDGALAPCVDEEGRYYTQDAASWIDHRLRLHRRLRPLPLIHGEHVPLDRVEEAISALPGVVEVIVAPESTSRGIALVAKVATNERTADEIRAWCAKLLAENWIPARIVICERLPRSPAGKILSSRL